MFDGNAFKGLTTAINTLVVIAACFIILGIYIVIDKVFIDHKTFKVKQPVVPKKEYVVKNNKVDSIYVYHF